MATRTDDAGSTRGRSATIGAVGLLIGAWAVQANGPSAMADETVSDAETAPTTAEGGVAASIAEAGASTRGDIVSEQTQPPETTGATAAEAEPAHEPTTTTATEHEPHPEPTTTTATEHEPPPEPTTTTVTEHGGGSGNPSRILFDVDWRPLDDAAAGSLDDVLPPGWRVPFVLFGESTTGSGRATIAECTYLAVGDNLVCEYHNPGHGGQDGLVVRARPDATYDVSVDGIPDGWEVVGATIGTFLGRDTCPRGDGHAGGGGSGGERRRR